jgi:hypothetical protein
VYHTGLHELDVDNERDPAFLTQWKLGCFATAFYADKCLATFSGRPPLLQHRYCTSALPLDLSDEILGPDGPSSFSREVMGLLSPEGWNGEGRIYRSSCMRLRLLLAMFRDKVLELTAARYDEHILLRAK